MVKDSSDHSARILSLSRDICNLSAELDRLLTLQASRPPSSVPDPPSPPRSTSVPAPPSVPLTYESFLVGDIVRITNRYGGYRGQLARILDTSASQTFELKLLHSGETLTKRKWNVDFVRRPST